MNEWHPDNDIDVLFQQLSNKLMQWNAGTRRDSVLIFREVGGQFSQQGMQASSVTLRLDNGVSIDPEHEDQDDAWLLARFADSLKVPPTKIIQLKKALEAVTTEVTEMAEAHAEDGQTEISEGWMALVIQAHEALNT